MSMKFSYNILFTPKRSVGLIIYRSQKYLYITYKATITITISNNNNDNNKALGDRVFVSRVGMIFFLTCPRKGMRDSNE
jgi:hypothetical protein